MNGLMRKALWPRDDVAAKDLEVAIDQRETDTQCWEIAFSESVSLAHRKLALEEMCPERLRAHLRLIGPEKLFTYEAVRSEIADWLAEELRKPARHRATKAVMPGGALRPLSSSTCR